MGRKCLRREGEWRGLQKNRGGISKLGSRASRSAPIRIYVFCAGLRAGGLPRSDECGLRLAPKGYNPPCARASAGDSTWLRTTWLAVRSRPGCATTQFESVRAIARLSGVGALDHPLYAALPACPGGVSLVG